MLLYNTIHILHFELLSSVQCKNPSATCNMWRWLLFLDRSFLSAWTVKTNAALRAAVAQRPARARILILFRIIAYQRPASEQCSPNTLLCMVKTPLFAWAHLLWLIALPSLTFCKLEAPNLVWVWCLLKYSGTNKAAPLAALPSSW